MFNQSLRRAVCPVLAFAALLLMPPPSAVSAQAAAPGKPRQWVSVTIDYVEVTQVKLVETSQWIASGPQHDAHLLAALVKNGATETKGVSVQCTDGGTSDSGMPVSLTRGATGGMPEQYSETKVTPHFNTDGTVTALLVASLASPSSAEAPVFSAYTNPTFHDGQTLEIQRTFVPSVGGRLARLVFARMKIGSGPVPPIIPGSGGLNAAQRALTPFVPPSIDPGMVATPRFDGDRGIVSGRDIDPKRIDDMNGSTLLPPYVFKSK